MITCKLDLICVFWISWISINAIYSEDVVQSSVSQSHSSYGMTPPVNQENDTFDLMKHNSSFIGFTAWKQTTQIYEAGDIIVFDGVTVNEGGHYDKIFNRFTCPYNDVYFITLTGRKVTSYNLTIRINVMNFTIALYDTVNRNPENIARVSCVVQCMQGEYIYVTASNEGAVFGESGLPHTTFTVMMMHEGDAEKEAHDAFIGSSVWNQESQSYVAEETIHFTGIFYNEGNHFQPTFGRFICPVTGIYYIDVNYHKYSRTDMLISVEKSSYGILHSDDTETSNTYNQLSNNMLVRCIEGEYISVIGTGNGSVFGSANHRTTIFSIMLITPEARIQHNSFVGFSAWKRSDQTYVAGDTIDFTGIFLNEGEYFNPLLSRFVCPFHGIYYVSVNFKKVGANDIQLGVEHQSAAILRSVETEATNPGNVVSNSCLVRCLQDEIIQVKAVGNGSVHGDVNKAHTTFTIMMMYQYPI